MKAYQHIRILALALLGLLFGGSYFWFIRQADFINLLKPQIPINQALANAEKEFSASPLGHLSLRRAHKVAIDEDLFRYSQQFAGQNLSEISPEVGRIIVTWKGKSGKNKLFCEFKYDFAGHLKGMDYILPELPDSTNLEAPGALARAKAFLQAQGIDTTSLAIEERSGRKEDNIQKQDFTFTKTASFSDNLKEIHKIAISAGTVTGYESSLAINADKFKFPQFEHTSDIVWIIVVVLTWIVILIIMAVIFFKRLKHEELEFKRAWRPAMAVMLLVWLSVGISSWPAWEGVLLGGGLAGLFSGVGILVTFALAESYIRDIWPEKIALVDLLFRGRLWVRELGEAMLRSLFIGGLTAAILGGIALLKSKLHIGYISVDNDDLWAFSSLLESLTQLISSFIPAFFVALIFLGFTAALLKSKIRRSGGFIILMALLLTLGGLFSEFLQPHVWGSLMLLPLAFLWGYWIRKYDWMTMFLSLFLVYLLFDLYQINLLPENSAELAGILLILSLAGYTLAGVFLLFGTRSVNDFEHYIPEYVSRIAERERFLRELEIARNIQIQFLPRREPQFPGLDIASICKPAMEVGGDYYDFIPRDDRHFTVVIGDVSGKGVSAAFYMTMIKGIIKTLARWLQEPSKVLAEVNEVFYENAPRNVFVSLLYAIFDLQERTLTFARAGHNPLLVRKSKAGEMESLNPPGLAIGMEKGSLFSKIIKDRSVTIETGDILIFYTDGITEAMNPRGDEFGEERLYEIIHQFGDRSAREILEQVRQNVFGFTASAPQHDDFTLVVVKVVG
ncbi:MAG: SpoIIE family protein phosphatase [Calditrichaceae bacterium]|nr:SpoIIE family protein phosphatase [Calditrichia bacterium]NUQ43547.1 SpoIIE family protein phosphatase [Calditrichaceae bacterium]